MSSDNARELRERGIQAAKAGQKDEARQLLMQSIKLDANNEAAWLWLASVARDKRERVFCLQKLLEINPRNDTALKALRALGESPSEPAEPAPAPAPPPAQPAARPAPARLQPLSPAPTSAQQTAGVPIPDPRRIEELKAQSEEVVQEYLERPSATWNWVHKTRRRAGERDIYVLRMQVGLYIVIALAVIGGTAFGLVWTNPQARRLLFAPTWTISPTPTNTATNTPGFTPTPSPTLDKTNNPTYTPTPTIPSQIRPGDPTRQPNPTTIYLPEPPERRIVDSAALINRGEYRGAVGTLEAERAQATLSFNPNPYYFEALALLGLGETDTALERLSEAENRLEEVSEDVARRYQKWIDAGFARVNLELAKRAKEDGDEAQAQQLLRDVEDRTEGIISIDPVFADAYVMLAERYMLDDQLDEALQVLNDALSVEELLSDLNLRVLKGEVYYRQGEYALAGQEAYEALYINPFSEPASLLQIRAALASEQPGLAVIYTQRYLFYFPGSTLGHKLLGDARVAEGNNDLALDGYSQALQGDENDPAYLEALIARANLYSQQRRYDLAREDLTEALTLHEDPEIQALRMQAAYNAGNYSIALNDTDELLGEGIVPDSELQLLQARILVDQARRGNRSAYEQALSLLNQVGGLPPELGPIADEYRARAQFELGNYDDALDAIADALAAGETGSRHYLRGRILEARTEDEENANIDEDRAEAIREYEWVVTWSQVYPFSFFPDARRRLGRLREPPPEPTPTPTPEEGD